VKINATGIAIAAGAGEIAFVGQPKADRKTIAASFPIISGLSRTDPIIHQRRVFLNE